MNFTDERQDERQDERERMVREQITARGISDARVLDALRSVPRHRFLPSETRESSAYRDSAQPIGERQTISQPYIVALMTEALRLTGVEKVLEIGAGSGYQSAVLSLLCRELWAIERHEPLARRAGETLAALGVANVHLFVGDGSVGWPAAAPYDAILVAAAAPEVPPALLTQLAPGGRLVLPVGQEGAAQHLLLMKKAADGSVSTRDLGEVAFVPLVGVSGFGLPDDLGDTDI